MLDDKDLTYDDNMNFKKFEFTADIPDLEIGNRSPFPPFFGGGGNFPPQGNYPPNFDDSDNDSYSSPNFNYPGGGKFNPPGMPKSPPPNYTPRKNDAGVQKLGYSEGVGVKAVSQNSIRFCLFKYTYIWQTNGRSYWAFLLNVDRRSVSGFRWFGRNWVYFGLDLRRIDSFVCYRSSDEKCEDCAKLRGDNMLLDNTKAYFLNGTRDVYTQTLASLDIPEFKEDFITETVAYLDENKVDSEIPCVKARNINYRLTLEVSYPSTYDNDLKNKINEFANQSLEDSFNLRGNLDDANPLENFNSTLTLAPDILKTYSDSFNSKLKSLNSTIDAYRDITYSIRTEKIYNNWKPYFYNDSLF